MNKKINLTNDYKIWLTNISKKIHIARTKASLKVNMEMLQLYWEIGNSILEVQKKHAWGSLIIDNLSSDIKKEFPNNTGFSVRNLKYMRSFAAAYPDFPFVQVPLAQKGNEFVQVALAQITWYHHISLLSKVKDLRKRAFYIQETARNEWSRNVMLLQIKSDLYTRIGKSINNFTEPYLIISQI